MAALLHHNPPPRTPSPKLRIHRSQSFDSPSSSSRLPITPIDNSPCSKSAGALIALPSYDVFLPGKLPLGRKMSEEEMLSDSDESESALSSLQSSPMSVSVSSPTEDRTTGSYPFPRAPSPPLSHTRLQRHPPLSALCPTFSNPDSNFLPLPTLSEDVASPLLPYQLPPSSPSPTFDPWLVRVVLDMFDVRGFDWMSIPDLVERVWRRRTSSAEVLGILGSNGRVGVRWWD